MRTAAVSGGVTLCILRCCIATWPEAAARDMGGIKIGLRRRRVAVDVVVFQGDAADGEVVDHAGRGNGRCEEKHPGDGTGRAEHRRVCGEIGRRLEEPDNNITDAVAVAHQRRGRGPFATGEIACAGESPRKRSPTPLSYPNRGGRPRWPGVAGSPSCGAAARRRTPPRRAALGNA